MSTSCVGSAAARRRRRRASSKVVNTTRSKTSYRHPIPKTRKTERVGILKVPPNPPHPIVSNQHENGPAAPPVLTCNACGSRFSDETRTPVHRMCARGGGETWPKWTALMHWTRRRLAKSAADLKLVAGCKPDLPGMLPGWHQQCQPGSCLSMCAGVSTTRRRATQPEQVGRVRRR